MHRPRAATQCSPRVPPCSRARFFPQVIAKESKRQRRDAKFAKTAARKAARKDEEVDSPAEDGPSLFDLKKIRSMPVGLLGPQGSTLALQLVLCLRNLPYRFTADPDAEEPGLTHGPDVELTGLAPCLQYVADAALAPKHLVLPADTAAKEEVWDAVGRLCCAGELSPDQLDDAASMLGVRLFFSSPEPQRPGVLDAALFPLVFAASQSTAGEGILPEPLKQWLSRMWENRVVAGVASRELVRDEA